MAKNVFITGANRGIGLGLVHHYLAKGSTVFAAARNPDASREFWELERDYGTRFRPVALDVTSDTEASEAAKRLGDEPLDLLINNAGILPKEEAFADVSLENMRRAFEVNVLGPMRVTQKLLANLTKSRRPVVVTISSKMGSITDNGSGGSYAYRTSKTAVNMVNKSFTCDHPKIIAVVLHPGWVQTDMGGKGARTTIEESVTGLGRVIDELKPSDSGHFFDFQGKEIPW